MSTSDQGDRLSTTLFGRTRRAVLALLYGHADEAFYLRQIARVSGTGLGTVQRELALLTAAGIIRRDARGRQVYYRANAECPVFAELKSIVTKTVGAGDTLRAALRPLAGRIRVAIVYGSQAAGRARTGSDVDVLVVGRVTFAQVVSALAGAQAILGREVNATVYPPTEFRAKVAQGHGFLKRVLQGPVMFLIGGENDLARLGSKWVVG